MFTPATWRIGEGEGWAKDMPSRREVIKGDSRVEGSRDIVIVEEDTLYAKALSMNAPSLSI